MYGHIKDGNGFTPSGEDNAWRSHYAMFSPAARPAMTTETRGQSDWVNFGPHGADNRSKLYGAGAVSSNTAAPKTADSEPTDRRAQDAEIRGWNSHRERHRRPITPPPPYARRRASRREQTAHNAAIHGFAVAIDAAEKHRRFLKKRFGYTDRQIASMAQSWLLHKG